MKPQACKNTSTDSPFFKNKYFLHHTENFWFFYKFKIHCIRKLSIRHMNVASCSNPAKTWMHVAFGSNPAKSFLSLLSFTFVFLLLFSQIIFCGFPPFNLCFFSLNNFTVCAARRTFTGGEYTLAHSFTMVHDGKFTKKCIE